MAASFALALSLAAPFVIASLLYNVALGVINKAMPQLMVAFVGAPAITCGRAVPAAGRPRPSSCRSGTAAFEGCSPIPLGAR